MKKKPKKKKPSAMKPTLLTRACLAGWIYAANQVPAPTRIAKPAESIKKQQKQEEMPDYLTLLEANIKQTEQDMKNFNTRPVKLSKMSPEAEAKFTKFKKNQRKDPKQARRNLIKNELNLASE